MIAEVDFFGKEKTFFHTDAKVSNSFHLFTFFLVYFELWHPKRIHELFRVLHDVVED